MLQDEVCCACVIAEQILPDRDCFDVNIYAEKPSAYLVPCVDLTQHKTFSNDP